MITISRPRMNGSQPMDATIGVSACTSQPPLVVDNGGDLLRCHEHAKGGHASTLHGLAWVGAGSSGRRHAADAAHAVRLAELGPLVHEVDVGVAVGELPDLGPV